MNEETRLNFARLHMGAWLPLTPWVTLSECLQASPSVLHGREVVECMTPFGAAVMGIDRNALQALVEGDIDAYEEEVQKAMAALGGEVEALPDGTYMRPC